MNAETLGQELTVLLSEIRSAGRGASRQKIETLVDAHFPRLVTALDPCSDQVMATMARDKGLERFVDAARERREAISRGESDRQNTWNSAWNQTIRRRRTWAWGLGLAAVAGVLMLATWYAGQFSRKEQPIAGPPPKPLIPRVPTPSKVPPKTEGTLAEKGPKTEIEVRPIPRKLREPSKLAQKASEAGKFGAVIGEPVVFAPGSGKGVFARPGMAIAYGSRIETGDFSRAQLKFADGTVLVLDYNTVLEVPKPGTGESGLVAQTEPKRPDYVSLEIGKVYATVVPLEDQRHFRVETKVATAEVLGTEFALNVVMRRKPDQTESLFAVLDVKTGEVRFRNDQGSVVASDLMRSTAFRGDKPTDPVRVRAFPGRWIGSTHITATTSPKLASTALGAMAPYREWWGIQVDTIEGKIWITKILAGSTAAEAGLKVKDIIEKVDGRPQRYHWNIVAIEKQTSPDPAVFTVRRDGQLMELAVRRPDGPLPDLPGVLSVSEQLGESIWTVGVDRRPARARLEELIQTQPHAAYWNNLGLLYEVDDEMGRAIRCYQRAMEMDSEYPLFRLNYARALSTIGNRARADEEVRKVVEMAPKWRFAILEHTQRLIESGKAAEAVAILETELAKEPDWAPGIYARGNTLTYLNRIPEAIAAFERYLLLEPGSTAALGQIATMHSIQGRFAEAKRWHLKSLEINPRNPVTTNNLGLTCYNLGQIQEAERWYRKTIELDPNDPVAYSNLGSTLRELGNSTLGEVFLRKGIQANAEFGGCYTNLGYLLWKQGRHREAEKFLLKGLSLDPRDQFACANLGSMWADDLGRGQEAAQLYRRFLKLTPGTGMILNNLASTLAELGTNLDEAIEAANKAIQAAPNRPNRVWTLADVYAVRKEWDLAKSTYLKAIEMYGSSKDAGECWEAFAKMFERKGEPEAAREAYRKALSIDPGLKKAPGALKRLGGQIGPSGNSLRL